MTMPLHTFPLPEPGLAFPLQELRADLDAVARRYPLSYSRQGITSRRRLFEKWHAWLDALPFSCLDAAAKVDYHLAKNHLARLENDLRRRERERDRLFAEFPFSEGLMALDEEREAMETPNPDLSGRRWAKLAAQIQEATLSGGDAVMQAWLKELLSVIERWEERYAPFDPAIAWWCKTPLAQAKAGLEALIKAGEAEAPGEIPGQPLGRDELLKDLEFEMVPYSPEELIAIGDREYAWCMAEMLKASAELGFGSDWRAAVEHVKDTAVPPGEQPEIVRKMALEAIEYVETRDLVTVPELAKEVWRMLMIGTEQQKVSPFFLGGETIYVSYPTEEMSDAAKRMSMRGNNPNFSRATVQHELIPGHHLQLYMTERCRPYRNLFETPFWIEGWTLYWELLLWELGFPRTPGERIGMLFWRMHRCARISFSIRFHLGELTTEECVQILTDRVGHERANAEGEVRRSFNGTYPPLYQAAYMIGGLQVMALKRELVDGGKMTLRDFHDAFLQENQMPISVLRSLLKGEDIGPEERFQWRFDQPTATPRDSFSL